MKRNDNYIDESSRLVIKGFEKSFSRQKIVDYYFGYIVMLVGFLIIFYGFEHVRREGVIDLRIFIAAISVIISGYLNVYGKNRNPYASFILLPAILFFRSIPIKPGWSFSLLLFGGSILAFIVDRKYTFDFYEYASSYFRRARNKQ